MYDATHRRDGLTKRESGEPQVLQRTPGCIEETTNRGLDPAGDRLPAACGIELHSHDPEFIEASTIGDALYESGRRITLTLAVEDFTRESLQVAARTA